MKTFILWHGGSSYAPSEFGDLEAFDSIQAAKESFISRTDFDPYYPCCYAEPVEDGGPSAWVFFAEPPEDTGDIYPDEVWTFGPKGGLNRCPA